MLPKIPKKLFTLMVAAAMATGLVTRAAADAHGLIGAIIGGAIVGSAIQNANKNKRKVVVHRGTPNATRAQNRETQTALNYFGFNAGSVDGVVGRQTRAAVSAMQVYMNFPVTGKLTQFERDVLIGAYQRGIAGSYDTLQLVSKDPDGTKALLTAQRDLLTGSTTPRRTTGYAGLPIEVSQAVDEIADSSDPSAEQLLQRSGFIQLADLNGDGNNDYILDTSFSGSSFWCSAVQCKSIVFVSTADGYARNDMLAFDPTPASFNCVGASCTVRDEVVMAAVEPPATTVAPDQNATTTATSEGPATLPLFAVPTRTVSLDSLCSKVSLLTNANGGYTQAAEMTDPDLVLKEQLCLARAFAIEDGETLVAQIGGLSTTQVDSQCDQFTPVLKEYVAGLALKPRAETVRDMGGFVLNSGMDAAQLTATARICLGSGYRQDDMEIALGAGLLLVALGEAAYGELMGHHLSQGFGTSKRPDLAVIWYQDAIDALAGGSPAVFAPDLAGRPALLQAAVDMISGGGAPLQPVEAAGSKAKLPTFGVIKNFGTGKK